MCLFQILIFGHYSRFAGLLIRALYGTQVYVYCDDENILREGNNKVLISSNHRTRIDWMFIIWIYGSIIDKISGWSLIYSLIIAELKLWRFRLLEMVVFLKSDMKKIPIIGWCMQMSLYIFLQVSILQVLPFVVA